MNIDDNYAKIFVSTILLSENKAILQFQPKFNVSFSKWVYNLSIYNV